MRIVLCLLIAMAAAGAAEPVAAAVDARIRRFESAVAAAFKPVQTQLDGWRTKRVRTAMSDVGAMLPKAGPRDRIYLAYQLLAIDPKNRAARDVYGALGLPPPFDEQGRPADGIRAPACDDIDTVAKAMELRYPHFDEVTRAVDLRGSVAAPFWKKLESEQTALRKDLAKLAVDRAAEQAANIVYPMLAYYQPSNPEVQAYYAATGKPAPAGRTWFNPVDAWLLDRELAGIDPLRPPKGRPAMWFGNSGGTDLPALVPGAAIEVISTWQRGARLELHSGATNGVSWSYDGSRITIAGLIGKPTLAVPIDVDLEKTAIPVRCAVRGRLATLAIGGIQIGELVLPQALAVRHWMAGGINQPRLVRVRYLAATPEPDLLGDGLVAAKPTAGDNAEPPWKKEREQILGKNINCSFEDQRLDEVASTLGRLAGVGFRIASSAEPLADLPVTMNARDVPLRTVLEWLHRLAEVEAVPEQSGFALEWRR